MKLKYHPAPGERGKVRNAIRKEMYSHIAEESLSSISVDALRGAADIVMAGGSTYNATEMTIRDIRVTCNGVFKAIENRTGGTDGGQDEDPEDPAAGL